MTNKPTVVLSFRIASELKMKLETRALLEQKTLTELVRNTLSHSEGEQIIESARKELTTLESDARDMSSSISTMRTQYREMIQMLSVHQKRLINEIDNCRKRLRTDRVTDYIFLAVFCLIGSIFGSLISSLFIIFVKNSLW